MKNHEARESTKSWTRKINIPAIVGLLIFLTMAVMLFALFIDVEAGELLAYIIFLVVILTLGILSARYKIVENTIEKFFSAWITFFLWMFITLLPIVAFNWLAQFMIARLALGFQIAVFVIWGLMLAWAIRLIATERSRERIFSARMSNAGKKADAKIEIGQFTPIVYSSDLLVIAVMFFASLTFVLVERGVVELSGAAVSYDSLMSFYVWHFLDAVPLLKINDTLQWKAPLTYQSGLVGFVLLLFKLAVIVPVIAAFAWYWKKVSKDDETEKLPEMK